MEDFRVTQTGDEIQEIFNQSPLDTADISALKETTMSLGCRLETVEGKIPSGASAENPLTDKQYVDDSIAAINEKIPSGASSENKLTTQSDVESVASNLQDQINEIVGKDTTVALSVSPSAVFADGTDKVVTFVATSSPTKATVVFDGGAPQEGTRLEFPVTVNSATPTTVSKTAQFTVQSVSKGSKTATVALVFPIYYGAGQSAAVLNTGAMTAHSAIASPSFIQSITTADNDYIFFEVPDNMANIQRLQLWDDPSFPTDLSIEAVETPREGYKAFKTVNSRLAGTHTYKVS